MADLQTTYISDLEQGTIQDSTLFVTDNGENTNSATAADVVNFAKEKILPEANSYADTKKSEAVEESKEYVNGVVSNENLLINWDFTNPVNQRGQTTYHNESASYIYTIDRWRLKYGTVNLNTNGIEFINSKSAKTAVLGQVTAEYSGIEGNPLTFSAIINNELYTLNINLGWVFPSSGSTALGNTTTSENMTMYVYARNDKRVEVQFYVASTVSINTSFTIEKCKLELGTISTLDNSSPQNYDEELIKCYGFYQKTPINNRYSGVGITMAAYSTIRLEPFKIYPMRIVPTITIFNVTGPDYNEVGTITATGSADKITGCSAVAYGIEYFIVRGSGFTTGTAYSFGFEADAEIYD